MKRMWIGTVVAAMAGWGLTGVPPVAEAKPATVDYVVTTIERNVAAGKWSLVAKNIEDLERTIRNEVTIRRSTVRLTGNPLQARLDAVQRRLDEIKSVYQPIYDTYVSLTEQAMAAPGAANAAIREELVSRIQATLERDLGSTLDTSTATMIVTEVKRMAETNINMSVVTGGGAVNSMPSYRKAVTPAVLATAFRLEFTGNGWFVADSIDVVGTPS